MSTHLMTGLGGAFKEAITVKQVDRIKIRPNSVAAFLLCQTPVLLMTLKGGSLAHAFFPHGFSLSFNGGKLTSKVLIFVKIHSGSRYFFSSVS